VPAVSVCPGCNAAICDLCAFPQDDGSRLCPACATVQAAEPGVRGGPALEAPAVQDRKCKQHPGVTAVQICHICKEPMCATCDFLLPGNFHVCPTCATAPQAPLSPKRKKMLIGSFALAGWCTLFMAVLLGGGFRSMARDKESQQALGLLVMALLLAPAIAGVALGVNSKGRSSSGSFAPWIAIAWNGMILGGYILLMIIGMVRKA
jgi:hypothetical protein